MTSRVASYGRSLSRALRHNHLTWRYLLNARPSVAYAMSGRPALTAEASRVLHDVNRDGIALSSVDALEERRAADAEAARRAADDTSRIGSKTFKVELLGSNPLLDADDVFCRLALARSLLTLANAYFGMFTRLRYFNVWHTLATRAQPRESQLWHRDRADFLIMKGPLHRHAPLSQGRLARGRDRLMYTCMFTSRVSQSRELFDRHRPVPIMADRAMAFAVR